MLFISIISTFYSILRNKTATMSCFVITDMTKLAEIYARHRSCSIKSVIFHSADRPMADEGDHAKQLRMGEKGENRYGKLQSNFKEYG